MSDFEAGFEPSPAVEPIPYAMTCRAGVWTLKRMGVVLMRSKNERRVTNQMTHRARGEAATGRPVVARKFTRRAEREEAYIVEAVVWTPELARAELARLASSEGGGQ